MFRDKQTISVPTFVGLRFHPTPKGVVFQRRTVVMPLYPSECGAKTAIRR